MTPVQLTALTARFRAGNPRLVQDGGCTVLIVDAPGATLIDLGGLQDALDEAMPGVIVLTPQELPASRRADLLAAARPLAG